MGFVFGKRSLENLRDVNPNLVGLLVYALKTSDIDFTIDAGVRTDKRQAELYSWGRTVVNPDTGKIKGNDFGMIVTNKNGTTNKSNHQVKANGFGEAVDLYPYINGSVKMNDSASHLKVINHIKKCAKELDINCNFGIDWKSPYDPPHIELK